MLDQWQDKCEFVKVEVDTILEKYPHILEHWDDPRRRVMYLRGIVTLLQRDYRQYLQLEDHEITRIACAVIENAEMPEEPEPVGIVGWTDAPVAYDGFGTRQLSGDEGPYYRHTLRKVCLMPEHEQWQKNRYGSGMYGFWEEKPVDYSRQTA